MWYKDAYTKSVFIHLLIEAEYKDNGNIPRGSLVTKVTSRIGEPSLCSDLGMTHQQIRTSLRKLERTGEITIRTSNKNTYITIVNYEMYQGGGDDPEETDDEMEKLGNNQANNQINNPERPSEINGNNQKTGDKPSIKAGLKEGENGQLTTKKVPLGQNGNNHFNNQENDTFLNKKSSTSAGLSDLYPEKQGNNPTYTKEFKEVIRIESGADAPRAEGELEPESEPKKPAKPKKPQVKRRAYGQFKWVKLSDDEVKRLRDEHGDETVKRYITLVDERAETHGNKHGWKNWNLVVRRAIREKWGDRQNQGSGYKHNPYEGGDSEWRSL